MSPHRTFHSPLSKQFRVKEEQSIRKFQRQRSIADSRRRPPTLTYCPLPSRPSRSRAPRLVLTEGEIHQRRSKELKVSQTNSGCYISLANAADCTTTQLCHFRIMRRSGWRGLR